MPYASHTITAVTLADRGFGRMGGHMDGRWGPGLFGLLCLFLLATGIATVAVVLARSRRDRPSAPPNPALAAAAAPPMAASTPASSTVDPALAHLRLRYARGEVTPEEFRRVSTDLGAPVADTPPEVPPTA